MFKNFKIVMVSLVIAVCGFSGLVMAQGTVLPSATGKEDCASLLEGYASYGYTSDIAKNNDQLLGCAIVTGRVSLSMVPFFIRYISNYILGLISIIALLFVVIGGFLYIAGGLTEQKDKGKTYIKNALIGMSIGFLAWSIVSVILAAITG